MNAQMPRSLRHWEITREKGRLNFIMLKGVLGWGLFMFVGMTFFVERRHWPLTARSIIGSACIWAVAGVVFGWTAWTITESKYQKFVATHGTEDDGSVN